ncbi:VOC family protein [Methylomagnum ishizawai]|uniref:VOC family protein n=1 Tax=Methylomagnum ishizawai TaxID=1760988 RepID=UPI001C33E8AF|nr:VOC family protein [Methylomagnum ishizawai]BBL74355.1 putative glyoxylase CFP32 [Methylomagnum ishizawai]
MNANPPYAPGHFSWADLATPDPAAAKAFYAGLFGWAFVDIPTGEDSHYTMCLLDGKRVCALFRLCKDQPDAGYWKPYVNVESADASAERALALGGQVPMPPMDIFQAGRMAMVVDPTGAALAIWEPRDHAGADVVNQAGSLCWNELLTHDPAAAGAFYTGLFGWEAKTAPMAPDGLDYTCFGTGGAVNGGMMAIQPEWGAMPPNWSVYFAVADCDASATRAVALGAAACVPPTDIPEVGRFAVLRDPQGAVFSIIQPNHPA